MRNPCSFQRRLFRRKEDERRGRISVSRLQVSSSLNEIELTKIYCLKNEGKQRQSLLLRITYNER